MKNKCLKYRRQMSEILQQNKIYRNRFEEIKELVLG
jgi:hypothetical protein